MGGTGDWGEDLKNSKSKKTANIIITYNRATKYRHGKHTHKAVRFKIMVKNAQLDLYI